MALSLANRFENALGHRETLIYYPRYCMSLAPISCMGVYFSPFEPSRLHVKSQLNIIVLPCLILEIHFCLILSVETVLGGSHLLFFPPSMSFEFVTFLLHISVLLVTSPPYIFAIKSSAVMHTLIQIFPFFSTRYTLSRRCYRKPHFIIIILKMEVCSYNENGKNIKRVVSILLAYRLHS